MRSKRLSRFLRRTLLAAAAAGALLGLASCANPVTGGTTITPIYAATSNGLSIYNGSSWTNVLPGTAINDVSVVGSGSNAGIYAATSGGLEVSSDGGSSWVVYKGTSPAIASATQVFQGINNLYVVGTTSGGGTPTLIAYNTGSGSWTTPSTPPSTPPWGAATVNRVFSNGTAYVATSNGLWIGGAGGWTSYKSSNGLPSNTVTSVFVDQSGDVYAVTPSGIAEGIPKSSGGFTWQILTLPGNAAATSLFVDTYGTIYAGTASNGLFATTNGGSSWYHFTTTDGIGSNDITGVFVTGQEIYLATTKGVSASKDAGQSWTSYTTANGLGSNTVNAVYASTPLYSY